MGKPFFVMERRHGYVVRDRWPPEWDAADHAIRRRAAVALVDALAALHAVDPADVDLTDLGRPEGFVTRQVENWSSRWDAAQTRELPDLDAAFGLLHRLIPQSQPAVVLHNDFKLDNTMVGPDGSLVAVFDWDMATLGDPLVDVGTMLAYWVDPDGATYPLLGVDGITLEPYLSRGEVLERYATATGLDLAAIHFYEGLALCRIAVIIEQIYARYAAGQTTDERFASFELLPPIFAAAAVEVLESG